MPHNSDIFIVDTSGLILLTKIDELELLKRMAKKVFITSTVRTEFGMALRGWITT